MPIDLTPIVKPINDLAEPLTNALSDAWSAVLGDKIAAWRLRNAAATQVKLQEELQRLGVSLDNAKIPERYAFAWFDEATKQDEPEIQELFARLLAKAAAGDEDASDRRNLEILSRMTPMDAQVMAWVFQECGFWVATNHVDEAVVVHSVSRVFGEDALLSLEHIVVLGIVKRHYKSARGSKLRIPWESGDFGMPAGRLVADADFEVEATITATERGMALYRSCRDNSDHRT